MNGARSGDIEPLRVIRAALEPAARGAGRAVAGAGRWRGLVDSEHPGRAGGQAAAQRGADCRRIGRRRRRQQVARKVLALVVGARQHGRTRAARRRAISTGGAGQSDQPQEQHFPRRVVGDSKRAARKLPDTSRDPYTWYDPIQDDIRKALGLI